MKFQPALKTRFVGHSLEISRRGCYNCSAAFAARIAGTRSQSRSTCLESVGKGL